MRRILLALAFILFGSAVAKAQLYHYENHLLNQEGKPVSNATVTVCETTGTGTPCTPPTTIYSDSVGTSKANPFRTDSFGNYDMWVTAGRNYIVCTSGAGTLTRCTIITPLTGGGGGGSAAGPSGTIQSTNGSIFTASHITDDGTTVASSLPTTAPSATIAGNTTTATLKSTGNATFGGPNPYYSLNAYGTFYWDDFTSPVTTTGSISSGSSTLTLASATSFVQGNGVRVNFAGAASTLSTPTSGICTVRGITGGSTSHTYLVRVEELSGAITAAGGGCVTTTAPATLGANSVTVTQMVRSGGVTTYTCSTNCNFESGKTVYITGFSGGVNNDANGTKVIASTPLATTFTVNESGMVAKTDTSGGTAAVNGYVQVTWGPTLGSIQTGVIRAYIYRDGTLVGIAPGLDPIWFDYGNDISLPFALSYVPTTTASGAQNGYLYAIINSISGTTATLSATASATVSGQTVRHDNTALLAAADSAIGTNSSGTIVVPAFTVTSGNPVNVYAPFISNYQFVSRASATVAVNFRGSSHIGATWLPRTNTLFYGDPGPSGAASFVSGSTQQMFANGYPSFLLHGQAAQFKNLYIKQSNPQAVTVLAEPTSQNGQSGYNHYFDNVTMTGTPTTDSPIILKASAFVKMNNVTLTIGSGSPSGLMPPVLRMSSASAALGTTPLAGGLTWSGLNYITGSGISIDNHYNQGVAAAGTSGSFSTAGSILAESMYTPLFRVNGGSSFFQYLNFNTTVNADQLAGIGTPMFDTSNSTNVNDVHIEGALSNNSVLFTGNVTNLVITNSQNQPINSSSYNLSVRARSNDEIPTTSGVTNLVQANKQSAGAFLVNAGGQVAYTFGSPSVAPTVTGPTAGGSVPVGAHTWSCSYFGYNGGESIVSPTVSGTATSGNQTFSVDCTAGGSNVLPTGAKGWMIQRDGARAGIMSSLAGDCSTPYNGSWPISDTASGTCSHINSALSYGASNYINANEVGAAKFRLNGTQVTGIQGTDTKLVTGNPTSPADGDNACWNANGGLKNSGCPTGTGPTLQTDGTPNGSQTLLNLISGSNITLADDGVGGVTITAAVTSATAWSAITGATTNTNTGFILAPSSGASIPWIINAPTGQSVDISEVNLNSVKEWWVDSAGQVHWLTAAAGSITGNAGTATALAASPTNCSAFNAPRGINASGTAQNCTAYVATFNGHAPDASGNYTPTINDYACSQVTNSACNNSANSFSAGSKQTVTANGTNAGLNIANVVGQPSSPASGDIINNSNVLQWYNGTAWKSFAALDSNITGNAATATALAADPADCAANRYATTIAANGDLTCALVSIPAGITGTLPVGNGGLGVATITGVIKGNGTSPVTAAVNTDVTALFTGTCNSSTFLRGDGTCNTPSGAGNVVAGTLTANVIPKATAATTIADSLLTDDGTTLTYGGTGGIVSTSSNAGAVSLGQGTDPGLTAGFIKLVGPAAITNYNFYYPGTAGSGFLSWSNTANKLTGTFRSIAATSPITITNGDGTAGNPTLACGTCGVTGNRIDQNNASTTSAQFFSAISDETGGTGVLVGNQSPIIVTPTIASLVNANHNHQNAAGGGTLDVSAIQSGNFSLTGARFANNCTTTTLLIGNAAGNMSCGAVNLATMTTGQIPSASLPSLTSAHIWVGNGSAVATDVAASGDVTLANTGAFTVTALNGTSLAGLATGILKNTTTTGVPSIAVAGDFPTLNQNTTGTAANLSGTPALPNGTTATTQTAASNDTKLATDAYVDGHFIANGTSAMGTSAISSGTCATVVTTAATGVATTDVIVYTPNTDPTAVTGYGPSASGSLYIWAYPTANNVNFKVCNNTSGSITPSALTLNWKVTR